MSDIRQVKITPAYNDGTYILTWEIQIRLWPFKRWVVFAVEIWRHPTELYP